MQLRVRILVLVIFSVTVRLGAEINSRGASNLEKAAIGEVLSMVSDPAREADRWAVSRLGLFHSQDAGATWQRSSVGESEGVTPLRIWAFRGSRTALFLGTAQHGLYRSLDGANWQTASRGLPRSIGAAPVTPVLAMAAGLSASNLLYLATEVDGVYRSEDGGQTWEAASKGLPVPLNYPTEPPLLAVDQANERWVYVLLTLPVHSHRRQTILFRSSDGGHNWAALKELPDTPFETLEIVSHRTARLTSVQGTRIYEDNFPESVTAGTDKVVAFPFPPVAQAVDRDVSGIAVLHDDGSLIVPSFNLDRRSIEFRPSDAGSYDMFTLTTPVPIEATELGTRLVLSDDEARSVALPFTFTFFGQQYNAAFVASNGHLTFGASGDPDGFEAIGRFFTGPPRIAPLWDDFNPGATTLTRGVFVNSGSDRIAITWSQIPEADTTNSNTFRAILFQNGNIRFDYGGVATPDGLTGLSPGGRTFGFFINYTNSLTLTNLPAAPIYQVFSESPFDTVAISRRFYQLHDDEYDALAVFGSSEFLPNLAGPNNVAFHLGLKNDVSGIGLSVFTRSSDFGSAGRLQSFLNMNSLVFYPADLSERIGTNEHNMLTLLSQMWGFRFAARVRVRDQGLPSTALLGRFDNRWNYFFDSDASVMAGNDWVDSGGGLFTAMDDTQRYSRLDQYLMGLRRADDVGPFMLVTDPQPLLTGTISQVLSTFGRTNNAIRDVNQNFGATDRLFDFRLAIDGTTAPLSIANTALIVQSSRTDFGPDVNVLNTISDLQLQLGAAAGRAFSVVRTRDSLARSRFWDSSVRRFSGPNIVLRGTRRDFSTTDIIAHEGQRSPAFGQAPTAFRHAFLLVVPKDKEALQADILKLDGIRRAWANFYERITENRSTVSTDLTERCCTQVSPVLRPGGGRVYASQQPTGGATVGFARLDVTEAPLAGVAIFASRSGNTVVSEAAVAATEALTRARFFAERSNSINTGFAAGAPLQASRLVFELRDVRGTVVATAIVNIPAGWQLTRFVDELFPAFVFPAAFRGSVTVTASSPIVIVTLRTIVNQAGEFLITTLPVADLDAAVTTGDVYLAQVADGGGYVTEVLLVNRGSTTLTGAADFRSPDGSPLDVGVIGSTPGETVRYRVEPNGTQVLATSGTSSQARTGYLVLRPDSPGPAPIAGAVFTLTQRGLLVAATGVTGASLATRLRIFVDRTSGHDTGIALVSSSDQAGSARFTLSSLEGAAAEPPATVSLAARAQTSRFISEIFPTLTEGFRVLDVVSTVPIAALGLRATISGGRFLLSTLPVSVLDVPLTPRALFFPHFAIGGGFSTEFILLNLGTVIVTPRLSFFSQGGDPLPLSLR